MAQTEIRRRDPATGARVSRVAEIPAEEITARLPSVADAEARALARLDAERARQEGAATVEVSVGGVPHQWHADPASQLKITGLHTAIARGVPVPDPRPWTPKGATQGVNATHAELTAIGAAMLAKADAIHNAKLAHERAIVALADAADVPGLLAYDVTTNWA